MMECKELVGKVVGQVTIFEDGDCGPEINFVFADGTNFNICLKSSIEAKLTLDEGGEPRVLRDYSTPAISQIGSDHRNLINDDEIQMK
jgi:hypothetical protein